MNLSPSRTVLRPHRIALAVALAVVTLPAIAAAAVNPGHTVASGPMDELVILEGYSAASGPVTVDVLRGGIRIGTSGSVPVPAGGIVEINHPVDPVNAPPTCWSGYTPNIVNGDVIRVIQNGVVETSQVRNLTVQAPAEINPLTIEVHGTAQDATGTRLPVDELEVRMLNPAFGGLFGGGPFILAPGAKAGLGGTVAATLTYDDGPLGTGTAFTATFVFSSAASQDVGMAADPEAGWLGVAGGEEATEVGVAPEPPEPGLVVCTEPDGTHAATATTPNIVSATTPALVVQGAAPIGATAVDVTLSDGNALTVDPTVSGTLTTPAGVGGKTWSATFTDVQIAPLANGTLTATPVFTPAANPAAISRTVIKNDDGLAPVTITAGQAEGSTSPVSNAQFSFTSPVSDATFQCRVDAGSFTTCISPHGVDNLLNGNHTFQVRAVDGATPGPAASRTWTVARPLPVATILTGPPADTNSTTAAFTFSANLPVAFFECDLDGAGFSACPVPATFLGLTDDEHTLVIRAVDSVGNRGPSSTPEYTWDVDVVAPNTTITSGPAANSSTRTAVFTMTSNEAPALFDCRIDGGAYAPCASPTTYTNLVDGLHIVDIRARDAAGNVDPTPAQRTWTVLGPPETTINGAPPTSTTSRSATFSFDSDLAAATFECSLDAAAFAPCASPTNLTGLAPGAHLFRVQAHNVALGLTDPTPAAHSWTIELPTTALTAAPAATTTESTATFAFTSPNDPAATFECSLDGAAFTFCATPTTLTGLGIGGHTFRVRALDAFGGVDVTPATHAWTIVAPDTEPPTVTASTAPLRKLTVGRNGILNIKVSCDERCTIAARASVNVPSPIAGGARKIYALRSNTIDAAAGATGQVRLKLTGRQLKAVRLALRAGKRVRLTITVIGTDAAGNTSNALRIITLTKANI
jgi:hypothetical protein